MNLKPCYSKVISPNDVYGRYTVINIFQQVDGYVKYALVKCSCGSKERFVKIDTLRCGDSKSCGCLQRETASKHGMWKHPLFKKWKSMMERCYNVKCKSYPRYGGRGIRVCDRWHNVHKFIDDMSAGYKKGLSIDRIDNDGDYDPLNCRWATTRQQNRNYSRNIILEYNGKSQCLKDWATDVGICYGTLWDRLKAGWSTEELLTTQPSND